MLITNPVCFRNQKLHAKKKHFDGSHRFCSPKETLEKLQSTPFACGVTRIADITGLDRIGIPVTLAIRPNGMTLSVSSGKGMTREAAWVSGVMEAYELYHCETYPFSSTCASYFEMSQQTFVPDLSQLCMKKRAIFNKNWSIRWVLGWDLVTQQEIPLPLTSVSLNCRVHKDAPFFELNAFERTSNGVASGNCFLEAICSGIYELIERDAISCHAYARSVYMPPKVSLSSIDHPNLNVLLDRLRKSGMKIILFDCTTDVGVYVFEALLYDSLYANQGIYKGFGAHLDPFVAMNRAITEAVQGRLGYISGSRDDLYRSTFQHCMKYGLNQITEKLEAIESSMDAKLYKNLAHATFEEDIDYFMDGLQRAGMSHIVVYDLNYGITDFSFVRVVIPGLEGYATSQYCFGKRAQQFKLSKVNEETREGISFAFTHTQAGGLE